MNSQGVMTHSLRNNYLGNMPIDLLSKFNLIYCPQRRWDAGRPHKCFLKARTDLKPILEIKRNQINMSLSHKCKIVHKTDLPETHLLQWFLSICRLPDAVNYRTHRQAENAACAVISHSWNVCLWVKCNGLVSGIIASHIAFPTVNTQVLYIKENNVSIHTMWINSLTLTAMYKMLPGQSCG